MSRSVVTDSTFIGKEGLIKKMKIYLKSTIEKTQNNIFEVISAVNVTKSGRICRFGQIY